MYSQSLDLFYIGSTANLSVRFSKHLSNHKGFTGKAKDWIIMYTESYELKTDALRREKQLKAWKNRQRIEKLIAFNSRNGALGS